MKFFIKTSFTLVISFVLLTGCAGIVDRMKIQEQPGVEPIAEEDEILDEEEEEEIKTFSCNMFKIVSPTYIKQSPFHRISWC